MAVRSETVSGIGFGCLIIFIVSLYCFMIKDGMERSKAREKHEQAVLNVCNTTCYPYTVEMCYYGDKNNVFIGCANDKEKLITKPLK